MAMAATAAWHNDVQALPSGQQSLLCPSLLMVFAGRCVQPRNHLGKPRSRSGMRVLVCAQPDSRARKGYWRVHNSSDSFMRCVNVAHCQGGAGSPCSAHRTGPLCALCELGYSADQKDKGQLGPAFCSWWLTFCLFLGDAECTACPAQSTALGNSFLIGIVM